jgi:carboxymethylenebutenolidase
MQLSGTEVSVHLPSSAKAPMPGVLMLHSALGARPAIFGYADDLAKEGYAVLALDLFAGQVPDTREEAMKLRDEANNRASEVENLIAEAYQKLSTDERIRATRRYLVGWSYGAAWATYAASKLKDLSGTVAYYGQNFTEQPSMYEQVNCPLLLIGGLDDDKPSPAKLREVEKGLKDHGKLVDLLLVKGGHGFAEPTLPAYDKASAAEAWAATLAFLER